MKIIKLNENTLEYQVLKGNKIKFRIDDNFIISKTLECGQCFRFYKIKEENYVLIAYNKFINIRSARDYFVIENTTEEDFLNIWIDYFDFKTSYKSIEKALLESDSKIKNAIDYSRGIRILRQEEYETVISFIISANNNIGRIRKSIDNLSKDLGKKVKKYKGEEYYSFPNSEILSKVDEEVLKKAGVGYRSKYIKNTAIIINNNEGILKKIKEYDKENAMNELIKFPGIGPKVANCIMFFSMEKLTAFPVDVWIKRIMEYIYFDEENKPANFIEKFAIDRYKNFAGYAQQYLFYYARDNLKK